MNILVTAGNTLVPIDKVRVITNIFTGRTGANIALEAHARRHMVTLLTSHPEAVADLAGQAPRSERWSSVSYSTFDDLEHHLEGLVLNGGFDIVIHCAAVSDYRVAGVYASDPATLFQEAEGVWTSHGYPPTLQDRSAGKIKSDAPELWLRLVRTPKLIDRIRSDWGFKGVLVKFKLEVGIADRELLEIAERSRLQSQADLMVANTLEGADSWAYLGPIGGAYQRIARGDLPARLIDAVERLHKE